MPWTMKVVLSSIRMLIGLALHDGVVAAQPGSAGLGGAAAVRAVGRGGDLLDRAARGLVHRHGAVEVLDPVALEDLEAFLLPGARDAENGDLLGRVVPELEARLDHAARDDVDAR